MKDRQETSNLAQVKQVFWQGTHKNIIVRFHADTDIEPCLGTHMWNRFLKPVLYTNNEQRSILYEYNYARFENPIKHQWNEGKPSDKIKNLQISEDFEVVTPYPRPGPAPLPTMDLKWAIAVKKQPPPLEPLVRPPTPIVNPPIPPYPARPPTEDILPTRMSKPPPTQLAPAPIPSSTSASTSAPPASATAPEHPPSGLFEPYVPPAAHPAHALYTEHKASAPVRPPISDPIIVKKMDPYEEGLDFVFSFGFQADAYLWSCCMSVDMVGYAKTPVCFTALRLRGFSDPIPTVDETEDFLSSFIPPASVPLQSHILEASPPPATVRVKPEPRDLSFDSAETLPGSDPTLELQQELARYFQVHPSEESELSMQPDVTVKAEPQDGNEETTQLPGPDPSDELHALLAEHLKQTSAVDSLEAEDFLSSVIPPSAPSQPHTLTAVPERVVSLDETLAGSDPALELLARSLQAHPSETHNSSGQPDVVMVKAEPSEANEGLPGSDPSNEFHAARVGYLQSQLNQELRDVSVKSEPQEYQIMPTTIHSSSKQDRRSVSRPSPPSSPASYLFQDNIPRDRSRSTTLATDFGRSSLKRDTEPSKFNATPSRDRSRSATLATDFGAPETQLRGPGQRLKRELSPEPDHKSEPRRLSQPTPSRPRPPPVQPYFSRVRTTQMGNAMRSGEAGPSTGTQTKRIRTEES
ncbi:uncharacterized protein LACBIDRAFT_294482 [Laccaria bicolor S238N-H82]|uniref:Predicted protein n=1 Tax=Laccaria bicolor (strain S238N-H82 / ATCC MYA-4686) TaxID=486041 RepID=B0DCD6_LACBS|nr:uncharacterized protein LACBIDRAFT_294482 [Laccaria bicolor S238N-H82]EDR07880.1 predicted protein [Laccaria bicolor S238N-H82]|eukprot:XP_001881669.1 predicted protein [Laccaria bicolor S238N-H82]